MRLILTFPVPCMEASEGTKEKGQNCNVCLIEPSPAEVKIPHGQGIELRGGELRDSTGASPVIINSCFTSTKPHGEPTVTVRPDLLLIQRRG